MIEDPRARASAKQCRASRPRIQTTLPGSTALLKPSGPGETRIVSGKRKVSRTGYSGDGGSGGGFCFACWPRLGEPRHRLNDRSPHLLGKFLQRFEHAWLQHHEMIAIISRSPQRDRESVKRGVEAVAEMDFLRPIICHFAPFRSFSSRSASRCATPGGFVTHQRSVMVGSARLMGA